VFISAFSIVFNHNIILKKHLLDWFEMNCIVIFSSNLTCHRLHTIPAIAGDKRIKT